MAFNLGNFKIDEIIMGVAEHDDKLLYTLDQLSSASIEISSESNDITDKNGNIVRTIYKNKTGTFTATNAFLHPNMMGAAAGTNSVEYASSENKIIMPRIDVIAAGKTVTLAKPVDDAIQVIGIFGSGANTEPLAKAGTAVAGKSYVYDAATDTLTLPEVGDKGPIKYLVKYSVDNETGSKIVNSAQDMPQTVKMTLYCSYVDPCDDDLKACYVVLPSFTPSPETTISLDSDNQEMDYSGNLQIDYCSTTQALYYIYFPDEKAAKVVAGE